MIRIQVTGIPVGKCSIRVRIFKGPLLYILKSFLNWCVTRIIVENIIKFILRFFFFFFQCSIHQKIWTDEFSLNFKNCRFLILYLIFLINSFWIIITVILASFRTIHNSKATFLRRFLKFVNIKLNILDLTSFIFV